MPATFARLLTRWPLRYTVPLLLSLVVVAGGAFGYFKQHAAVRTLVIGNQSRLLRDFIALQAAQLGSLHARGERGLLQEQVAALATDRTIEHAWLVDDRGEILASTRRLEVGERVRPPAGAPAAVAIEVTNDLLRATAAVRLAPQSAEPAAQGRLHIDRNIAFFLASGLQSVHAALRDYLLYFFAIALVLWAYFEWAIKRRSRQVVEAIEGIARGETPAPLALHGQDEIAEVAAGTNAASAALARARNLNLRMSRALEQLAFPDADRDIFDAIAHTLREGLDCRWAGVGRHLPGTGEIELLGVAGDGRISHGLHYPLQGTPCALGCQPGDPVVIVPRDLAARFPDDRPLIELGAESYRGAGLFASDGRLVGVLFALDDRPCADEPSERALLKTAAGRAAQELQRAEAARQLRLAEQQLRDKESHLALALDSAGLAEAMWDIEHDRLEINPRWPLLLGYAPDEIGSRRGDWAALTHPDDAPRLSAAILAHRHHDSFSGPIEFRQRMRDGSWRPVQLCGRVLARDEHGKATRAVGIFMDMQATHQAAELLRERSEFLELAVRGSMDGLWDWDIDSDRLYLSPRFHELLGYQEHELPRTRSEFIARFCHPDDQPAQDAAAAAAARAVDGVGFVSLDNRLRARSGEWRWYHTRGLVTRDSDGRPRRLVGSISDITERKAREEELARTRQQFQDAIEHIDAGLLMSDAADRLVLCNRRYGEMFGFAPELLRAGTPLATLSLDLHQRHPEYLEGRTLDEAVAIRMAAYRARNPNWELKLGSKWFHVSDFATADGGAVSLRTDITVIKDAEQALRESEARLRTVLDNSPVGIFLNDPSGGLIYGNRAYLEVTHLTAAGAGGFAWQSHIHSTEREALTRRWIDYCAHPNGVFSAEYRSRATAGDVERLLHVRAVPVTEHERVLGFAGTLEDITARHADELARQRLERQVQQAQKMQAIGQLTGGIAHDFNNILASILGYTTLAQVVSKAYADAKLDSYHAAVCESADRARELVLKMLAFGRPATGRTITPSSPLTLLEETVRFLQPIIPAGIRVVTDFEADVGEVLVDSVDLHQTLVNLALNARDAIGAHGEIKLSARRCRRVHAHCASCNAEFADDLIEIAVADDGPGIPPEQIDRIFEPFFSTKEVGKGSGMGLAVTHGLVHAAGGHIIVESAAGRGTIVRLLLRPGASTVAGADAPPAATHPSHAALATVLVVDDEPQIARMLTDLLEGQGYRVFAFTDSTAALAWASTPDHAIDAVITDQTMPGLSGLELACELHLWRGAVPIILCTGYSDSVTTELCSKAGIDAFFRKPVAFDELLAALATATAAHLPA